MRTIHFMLAFSALAVAAGGSQGGAPEGLLTSNRDRALAINAWGGARPGTPLRLHNGCNTNNPDCVWSYRGGLLYSVRDPSLAIKAERVETGAGIVLANGCNRQVRGCVWIYRDGMFVSENTNLAISAWGGARYGTVLRLSDRCRSSDADCTWSR